MRGKVHLTASKKSSFGITPAHAGKSFAVCDKAFSLEDHPRTCGEKALFAGSADPKTGSPPHMRGKDFRYRFTISEYRITPAHAGKSNPLKQACVKR